MKTRKSWNIGSSFAGAILLGALAVWPVRADYPSLILTNSPVDYWRFSETTPSPALNTVSNLGSAGLAGTGYVLDGGMTGQPGIVGNCVLLTNTGQNIGDCYSRIDIPNLPALNPEPPFTIEFWMKPNSPFSPTNDSSPPAGLCPLSSDSPNPGQSSRSGYLFYVLPGSVTFRLGGEDSYTATAVANFTVPTKTFTHVVAEFDGTTASLYINGVLAGSGPASPSAPFYPNQWVPTRVGGTSLNGGEYVDVNNYIWELTGNRGWDGWIDEFAVYNNLLSSSTIASHYSTATNNPSAYDALVLASSPVGYWNFDEPAYTAPSPSSYPSTADTGSLGVNGTNTLGSLADQPGVPGLSAGDKSVFYSGEAGSLVLDTNAAALEVGGQTLTLAAWIRPATLGVGYAGSVIVQGPDPTANYEETYLRLADTYDWEGNGDPDVTYYDFGTYNGGSAAYSAIFPVPPGDLGHWVFLAGTWDGANWNLYRNGTLVGQYADTTGPASLTIPWSVGSRSVPDPYLGFFFPGSIAEAAIFTNALDAVTISDLYNSVALPPVITQAPVAPSPTYEGSSAAFFVWADGPGTLTYQWTSNSVPLAGQTTTNLTLGGLTAAADGTYSVIVSNQYGAVTSSAVLVVTPTLPPVTLVPASETRWIGSPVSFAPASLPNQKLYYQWNLNGHAIGGATGSNYTATTSAGSVGSYTLIISNSYGTATSSISTLSVLTPAAGYATLIVGDNPLSYFRLDETNGTTAYDYAGGNNGAYYGNVTLGATGYSLIDTDTAAFFPGVADSYCGDIGATTINFAGTNAEFSIEAWANGAAGQISGAAVIAKGTGNVGGETASEQFAIGVNAGIYRFFVRDPKGNIAEADATTGPDGAWHHLVGVCDGKGGTVTFYVDGTAVASATPPAAGIRQSSAGVSIGAERSGVLPTYDWAYKGAIDEVAIYAYPLSVAQIQAHYSAAYGPNQAPFITVQPVSVTNYVTLPVTLTVGAAGSTPLNYQWNKAGSGPISGATSASFTIANLAYTDAGTYTVGITNTLTGNVVTGIVSAPVTITVLAPPTNPPAIAGLVLHLPFDGNLNDATGRGNNATNEASGGAPLITNNYVPGVIGQAFSYQTTADTSTTNANYASLGVRPDLQFSSNINFSVSLWVQLPLNYTGDDLPFFTDAVGSTFNHGYVFAPSSGTPSTANPSGWPGGWAYSIFDNTGVGIGVFGDIGTINDGNWHSLIYVVDRATGTTVYLDGLAAHQVVQAGSSIDRPTRGHQ